MKDGKATATAAPSSALQAFMFSESSRCSNYLLMSIQFNGLRGSESLCLTVSWSKLDLYAPWNAEAMRMTATKAYMNTMSAATMSTKTCPPPCNTTRQDDQPPRGVRAAVHPAGVHRGGVYDGALRAVYSSSAAAAAEARPVVAGGYRSHTIEATPGWRVGSE